MSKRWITAVVATVIVGGTLGFVLSEALQPEGDTAPVSYTHLGYASALPCSAPATTASPLTE